MKTHEDLMGRLRDATVTAIALASVTFGSSSMAAEQCAETDFDAFLARFSEDHEFQRRHVQFPLPTQAMEFTADGPELVDTPLQSWPATGALYSNAEERKKYRLEVTVTPTERGKRVKLKEPGADFLTDYYFEEQPCWTLVRIEYITL